MALVGDILIRARELAPDMPVAQDVPDSSVITSVLQGPAPDGPNITAGSYYVKITLLTPWGETTPTATEYGPITVDGTHGIVVSSIVPALPVTGMRVYLGTASGKQNRFYTRLWNDVGGAVFFQPGATDSIILTQALTSGKPPTRNTAWLPDTAGGFASSQALFGWLNEGLLRASKIVGGIDDVGGIQAQSGVGVYSMQLPALASAITYQLPIQWLKVTQGWYDGIPLYIGAKADIFRRNSVTGTVNMLTMKQNGQQQVLEFWPQASRTGAATTCNAPGITTTSSSMTLASVAGFLPMGIILFQHDAVPGLFSKPLEIMSYSSISGNQLLGLQRGLGGTVPGSSAGGSNQVIELNLQFNGKRQPSLYQVGDSIKLLQVPPAWETLLPIYLLHKYKMAAQEMQEAQQLLQQFETEMQLVARANRQAAGPSQVGGPGGFNETYGGSAFGRWIVP